MTTYLLIYIVYLSIGAAIMCRKYKKNSVHVLPKIEAFMDATGWNVLARSIIVSVALFITISVGLHIYPVRLYSGR